MRKKLPDLMHLFPSHRVEHYQKNVDFRSSPFNLGRPVSPRHDAIQGTTPPSSLFRLFHELGRVFLALERCRCSLLPPAFDNRQEGHGRWSEMKDSRRNILRLHYICLKRHGHTPRRASGTFVAARYAAVGGVHETEITQQTALSWYDTKRMPGRGPICPRTKPCRTLVLHSIHNSHAYTRTCFVNAGLDARPMESSRLVIFVLYFPHAPPVSAFFKNDRHPGERASRHWIYSSFVYVVASITDGDHRCATVCAVLGSFRIRLSSRGRTSDIK